MPERPALLRIGLTVEGPSDERFFAALLPRLVSGIAAEISVLTITVGGQDAAAMSRIVCRVFHDRAIDLICIHRDADSANAERRRRRFVETACEAMSADCSLPPVRCIPLIPFREMETWALSDPKALAALFRSELPSHFEEKLRYPEALADPKGTFQELAAAIQRRPRPIPFDRLGSEIALEALGRLRSFRAFLPRFQNAYQAAVATPHPSLQGP